MFDPKQQDSRDNHQPGAERPFVDQRKEIHQIWEGRSCREDATGKLVMACNL